MSSEMLTRRETTCTMLHCFKPLQVGIICLEYHGINSAIERRQLQQKRIEDEAFPFPFLSYLVVSLTTSKLLRLNYNFDWPS